MNCPHFGICGGCPAGGMPYSEQVARKAESTASIFANKPTIHGAGEERVRDRVELIWDISETGEKKLGLFKSNVKEILDIAACPMMSESLERWFQEYRTEAPPIRRGTVRLRVGPDGTRGAWLDFANLDVKNLFDEKKYLKWLSDKCVVEIGQRRKRLVWKDGLPKLTDAELAPWFETYGRDGSPIPVYGVIGGFTQVGFRSNRVLVDKVVEFARETNLTDWVELFAGSGNFALALADYDMNVCAYENDELSISALERSRDERGLKSLEIARVDVYHHPHKIGSLAGKGLLVDPPRSGLGKLLGWLEAFPPEERPPQIIYVSCFTDSFLADVQALAILGYKLVKLEGVDQFPHSHHMEWVGLLVKS